MFTALGASVDRRIANVILARVRRRWLPLRFVPAVWLRPFVKPAATLVRRELARIVAVSAALAGVVAAMLLLLRGGI